MTVLLASTVHAAPKITCKAAESSFGTVAENGGTVEHVFTIENEGDAVLQIGYVRACCGSTASIATNSIAPGSNTALKVVLSMSGRHGEVRKSIFVGSNDPKQPYFQVRLLGRVASSGLSVSPRNVDFGVVDAGAVVTRDVAFACDGWPFRVTNVVSSSRSFSVIWNPAAQTNSHSISIGTVPPLAPGVTTGSVCVLTDNTNCLKVAIPVVVAARSDLMVVPPELLLMQKTGEVEAVTRYLAVRSRSGKLFKVIKVDAPDQNVNIVVTPLGTNGWQCRVSGLLPGAELRSKNVIIWTDHPDVKQITVPIRVNRE
ncbi:MAG: DUF1573 domain-containing protein [Kiritimatiellia bacterium]